MVLNGADLVALLGTAKPAACRVFYADILGLKLISDESMALVFDSNGTMLRISKLADHHPLPFTVLGWQVIDLDRALETLLAAGVSPERFEGQEQDERGIADFESGARVAWLRDPDGNLLSLTEFGR